MLLKFYNHNLSFLGLLNIKLWGPYCSTTSYNMQKKEKYKISIDLNLNILDKITKAKNKPPSSSLPLSSSATSSHSTSSKLLSRHQERIWVRVTSPLPSTTVSLVVSTINRQTAGSFSYYKNIFLNQLILNWISIHNLYVPSKH